MTFSIVGYADDPAAPPAEPAAPAWGVAVASKFLAVGAAVPAAAAWIGAVATQANAHVGWKRTALQLLADGASAADVVARLTSDDGYDDRQIGIVDRHGAAASHTGPGCLPWAGGLAEPGLAVQGNVLTGPQVLERARAAWHNSAGAPLAHRLLAALAAGDDAGGDRRGRQSAALYVVRTGAGYGGLDDVAVDLRVDDAAEPIPELRRLLALNDFYLTASTEQEKVPVTPELADELEARARRLGADGFLAWVGTENYEMRVAEDAGWIDRAVLAILRRS